MEMTVGKKKGVAIAREHLLIEFEGSRTRTAYQVDDGVLTWLSKRPPLQIGTPTISKDRLFLPSSSDFLLHDSIESTQIYNFVPDAIRALATPSPGGYLERDGSNIASALETTHEIDDEAIDRISRYLASITGAEFLRVVHYGDYETVRFRVPRGNAGFLEFDGVLAVEGVHSDCGIGQRLVHLAEGGHGRYRVDAGGAVRSVQ